MAMLIDRQTRRSYPLTGKVTLVGRDPHSDIVVPAPTTSSRHAIIVHAVDRYFIEDLDSLGGTRVNGTRIDRRTELRHGDQIELPGQNFYLELTRPVSAASGSETLPPRTKPAEHPAHIVTSVEIGGDTRLAVKPEAKLRAVLEIARNLGNSLDLKTVLSKTLESLFVIFPNADCGFILLVDELTGQLVPRAVRHRGDSQDRPLQLSRGIVEYVTKSGLAVLSADAGSDARFEPTQSIHNLSIRSLVCAPLRGQDGQYLGVVQIDSRNQRNMFVPDDLDLLACASVLIAREVELARVHEERRELEAATRIQKSFLPSRHPDHPYLRFFDHYSPAQRVGGDYYDYIPLPDGRLAVAIGDVSGKGISAALLMARVSAAARFALATSPTVAGAVRELNRALLRTGSEERFVTFAVAVIDLDRSSMTVVNAGHIPPLRMSSERVMSDVCDEVVGLPLAVMDRPYEELIVPFEPGDVFVFCTDGLTEARDVEGELYGRERLRSAIESAPNEVERIGRTVLDDVRKFTGTRPLSDDLTVVCFGRIANRLPNE